MNKTFIALAFSIAMAGQAYALDQIETLDGSVLTGTIRSISASTIILVTSYAGVLELQRDQVKGFNTEQPVFVRLKSGTTLAGQVSHDGKGQLVIKGIDATMTTNTAAVVEGWSTTDSDPQLVRVETERDALKRKWSYKAAVDIAGKSGNSEEFSSRVLFDATLASVDDALKFYASIDKSSKEGDDISDETVFGSEYKSYFSETMGWYVRGEVERDDFEDLELRTILGGGLNYRVFKQEEHVLELRSGLGYRYESFNDGSTESSPTLDFGLEHYWKFISWAEMTNKLTYQPSIDDFKDYLLTHDSGIDIPLGLSDYWNIRFGLRNDYKNLPVEGREELDTSYYSRIQLKW
jgi:putative salt-induced outer membrane protein YdiY